MEQIKQFFENIGRSDITSSSNELLSQGILDSIDIMALIAEIENFYKRPLQADYIKPENFEDFETIKKMLDEAMK